ncbi:MAG: sugar ABC transporter ATP-binding protein [Planctomycetota bacterium]|jgi:ribose transport system ATP-binding protein
MIDSPPQTPILEARGISKSFPGVQALREVDFSVYAGQVNALVGENGAGKSTLMNVLAGVCAADAGTVRLAGNEVAFSNAWQARRQGIAVVHQELNLIPHMSIAENIFLGREFQTPLGLINYRRMNREAARLLDQLELDVDPRTPVARLRVGQQQVVEIAKALSTDPRVLIMDEPTSAISDHEVEVLFRLIEHLKTRQVAIIYITHKLDELFRIGDRVTVLRDGRRVASGPVEGLSRDDVVGHMVGRDMSDLYQKSRPTPGREVLRVENVRLWRGDGSGGYLVDDVSFHVCRGEVLGIFGLMGAGRTELLETIFGLHPRRSSGTLFIDGVEHVIRSPNDAIRAGIGLAPEDRKAEGLVLSMSVVANVSLASLDRVVRHFLLSPAAETALADRFVERLGIKTPSTRRPVRHLSGGNQQKVIVAKWMSTEPGVLLLDEPTRGVDVGAKREVYRLIDELTSAGLAVVMVSSELPEVLAVSDRVMVMSEGGATGHFDPADASEEEIIKAALPGSV